ncbi:MAG: hypothetical protein L0Z50_15185 [Verrucomicrobiales bacterium]|nr:hypothetical protein [Verrucomicrobiales bacterium]
MSTSSIQWRSLSPAVAANAHSYLVVWQDSRDVHLQPEYAAKIYGVRLNFSGSIMDREPFLIATDSYYESPPAIVGRGNQWFVTWVEATRELGVTTGISGTFIASSGAVGPRLVLSDAPVGWQPSRAMAVLDDVFLTVWEYRLSGARADIYGCRVSAAGEVLDFKGFPISAGAWDEEMPSVASDGQSFLVAWRDSRFYDPFDDSDIYGARVTTSGTVLDKNGFPVSKAPSAQYWPRVAGGNGEFLVAWSDYRNNSGDRDVFAARIAASGTVMDSEGILLSLAANDQRSPSIAGDGSQFLAVWEDSRDGPASIFGSRLDGQGAVLDPDGILIRKGTGLYARPQVAFNGETHFVVWAEGQIYGTRVSVSGQVLDTVPMQISRNPYGAFTPAVQALGTAFLVVWVRPDSALEYHTDIHGARVAGNGTLLDTNSIFIGGVSGQRRNRAPALASSETEWLITWTDERNNFELVGDIYGARVSRDGILMDTNGIPLVLDAMEQRYPAISFGKTNYAMAWEDWRNVASLPDIFGSVVSTSGNSVTPFPFDTAPEFQRSPALTFSGDEFVALWMTATNSAGVFGIRGTRLSQAGARLGQIKGPSNVSSFAMTPARDNRVLLVTQKFDQGANRLFGQFIVLTPDILRATAQNETLSISWMARVGRTYRLQFKSALSDTVWQDVAGDVVATDTIVIKADLGVPTQRFYRVVELPE